MQYMKKSGFVGFNRRCIGVLFVFFTILSITGCQEDFVQQNVQPEVGVLQSDHLTVEQAYRIYNRYVTKVESRGQENVCTPALLHPGQLTNDWECAMTSLLGINSYVSVPSITTQTYIAKSPRNAGWVQVVQKVVVVQDDSTRKNNVYLLNVIPEGKYVDAYPEVLAEMCNGGEMPADFSGRIIYTKLRGGLVLYIGSYQAGKLEKSVFLFDKRYPFQQNIERINEMLDGYYLEKENLSTRSGSTPPEPGDGDNWQFNVSGSPFLKDGLMCWNATDSNGNKYIVADTDGDGEPDTILDEDTDIGGSTGGGSTGGGSTGGGSTGGGSTGGGSTGGGSSGGGSTGGGDINPGGNCPHARCPICKGCIFPETLLCCPCTCVELTLESDRKEVELTEKYTLTAVLQASALSADSPICTLEMKGEIPRLGYLFLLKNVRHREK